MTTPAMPGNPGKVVEEGGAGPRRLRVLLVTSNRMQCGVREYGRLLHQSLSDQGLAEVVEFPFTSPDSLFAYLDCPRFFDIIHLNHHAALHSEWRPQHVQTLQKLGYAVVVTQHDTFETWRIMEERGFQDFQEADALVVHELVEGLKAFYLRQPVPDCTPAPMVHEPVLGLVGFAFPWKGFETAIQAARIAGWNVQLFSNDITPEKAEALQALHPGGLEIVPGWLPTEVLVHLLSLCRATAFLYSTGNSGTSGAIRLGFAARRPVIATTGCRQFRDLRDIPWLADAIRWTDGSATAVADALQDLACMPTYYRRQTELVVEAAKLESWGYGGHAYWAIYQVALEKKEPL